MKQNYILRSRCEVCGGNSAAPVKAYTTDMWPLMECGDCSFTFLTRVPDYGALNTEIAWDKSRAEERKRRRKRRWARIDMATRFRLRIGRLIDGARHNRACADNQNVLEIGCGSGTRIPEGPTPFGIEISENLAAVAAPIYEARGGRLVHSAATVGIEGFPNGFFDTIIMRSYLEHEAAPRLILTRAFAKLKPGGKVTLRLPNYASLNRHVMRREWCGFRFPDHVNYFTPRSLRRLGESIGFKFQWRNWFSLFDDNIIAVLSKPTTPVSLQLDGRGWEGYPLALSRLRSLHRGGV